MSAEPKPRFLLIAGRPVAQPTRESAVEAARRRHGKPFCFEPGAQFEWQSGPTVLDAWLHKRRIEK